MRTRDMGGTGAVAVGVLGWMLLGPTGTAHACPTDAELADVVVAERGVGLCRAQDGDGGTLRALDCWQVDLTRGSYAPAPLPETLARVPAFLGQRAFGLAAPSAVPSGQGARLCPAGAASGSACHEVPLARAPDGETVLATNEALTLLAVSTSDGTDTYDVASGAHLAHLEAGYPIVRVLGTTLFVNAPCAGPCPAELYDAKSGRRIAAIGKSKDGNHGADVAHVRGDVWAFVDVATGLVFQDVHSGRVTRRVPATKLVANHGAGDGFYARIAAVPGIPGAVVVVSEKPLGDVTLVTASGVRRFVAPACKD